MHLMQCFASSFIFPLPQFLSVQFQRGHANYHSVLNAKWRV